MRVLVDAGYISYLWARCETRWELMDRMIERGAEIVFDSPRNVRAEKYPWYKSNRGDRLPIATKVLGAEARAFRKQMWRRYSGYLRVDGLEADDVIAIESAGCSDCLVVTTDHDMLQLPNVHLMDQHLTRWGIERIRTKLPLEQGRSYLAYQLLMGCSTDTVPRRLLSRDIHTAKFVFAQMDPLAWAVDMLPEDLARESLECLMLPTPIHYGRDAIEMALERRDR
jgi:hypothetical protein